MSNKLQVKNRYGVIPNDILNNPNLSFKAKGLFGYIQSKPDGWDFSVERIMEDSRDGRESVTSGIKELEDAGLLERIKHQKDLGHWGIEYTLHEKPYVGFSDIGKHVNNSKKEIRKKELITSIDVISEKSHIEEKLKSQEIKPKPSSSIRKVPKVREIIVPPAKNYIDQVLGQKRGVDKFYEIITLPNMKDYEILRLDNPEDLTSFTKLVALYEWTIAFFQEKYDGKIYKDTEGKMVGSGIILNEFDKFIAYYAENKKAEDILDLKSRLRKWITNSLKYL